MMSDKSRASGRPDDLEIKVASVSGVSVVSEDQGIVECIPAVMGNKDLVGDIIYPGAVAKGLKRRKPKVVQGHDWNKRLGKVLDLEEIGPSDPRLPEKLREKGLRGLYCKAQFAMDVPRARDEFNMVKFFGEEQEWSIGYRTHNPKQIDPVTGANILSEIELFEISTVLHGANSETTTISAKGMSDINDERMSWIRSKLHSEIGKPIKIIRMDAGVVWFEVAPGVTMRARLLDDDLEIDQNRITGLGRSRPLASQMETKLSGYEMTIECGAKDAAYMVWAVEEADVIADLSNNGVLLKFGASVEHDETLARVVSALSELDELPDFKIRTGD